MHKIGNINEISKTFVEGVNNSIEKIFVNVPQVKIDSNAKPRYAFYP